MIITNSIHHINTFNIYPNYWNNKHVITGSKVEIKTEIKKSSVLGGIYKLWFTVPFNDVETNEWFINYKSESTVNFMLEDLEKDCLDFTLYHNAVYDLIISFIKEHSLGYFDRLRITPMLFSEPGLYAFYCKKII